MSKDEITPAELGVMVGRVRTTKYRSRRTFVPELERWFDSRHEADVAVGLWRRQRAGEVRSLHFQVRFPLDVGDECVGVYVADFVYDERRPARDTSMGEAWVEVVADAKGFPTPVYKLKKRLMKAIHGVEVVEL